MTAVLLAAALAVTAPKLKDRSADDPLLGRWAATGMTVGGAQDPLWRGREYEFRPDGRWVTYRDGADVPGGPRSYTSDPIAKPARVDLTDGPGGRTLPGVYKVDGDTLTVAYPFVAGGRRPTDFAAGAGIITFTFKRVPKD